MICGTNANFEIGSHAVLNIIRDVLKRSVSPMYAFVTVERHFFLTWPTRFSTLSKHFDENAY